MANPIGRPPKFESVNALNELIEEYFETPQGKETPTVSGLALHLDTTRRTLLDYCEQDDEFSHAIKKAKNRVEAFVEQRLYGNSVTGLIFNLKNNFGWVDKTEQDITTAGEKIEAKPVDMDMVTQYLMMAKDQTKQ